VKPVKRERMLNEASVWSVETAFSGKSLEKADANSLVMLCW